jgi:hypothetical protein
LIEDVCKQRRAGVNGDEKDAHDEPGSREHGEWISRVAMDRSDILRGDDEVIKPHAVGLR